MANLIITEFARSPYGDAAKVLASQTLAISGTAATSSALHAHTETIRLFAEGDCSVSVADVPDVDAGAVIPLAADQDFVLRVGAGSRALVQVVARTVA
jgi:hypothetical protein